jgi:hypothetical protein
VRCGRGQILSIKVTKTTISEHSVSVGQILSEDLMVAPERATHRFLGWTHINQHGGCFDSNAG